MNLDRAGTSNSLQYLIWLNSKAVKIYSIVESVKLLLALSIHEMSIIQRLALSDIHTGND